MHSDGPPNWRLIVGTEVEWALINNVDNWHYRDSDEARGHVMYWLLQGRLLLRCPRSQYHNGRLAPRADCFCLTMNPHVASVVTRPTTVGVSQLA